MSALCCAARHGFEMDNALDIAEKTYVGLGVDIHKKGNSELQQSLEQLPGCCVEAADELERDREIYTSKGVFSDSIVDYTIDYLRAFDDKNMRHRIVEAPEEIVRLVEECINDG